MNPKKPGKVRIVYDCAATTEGKSLNDFLMKGPDLMNTIVGVLLRFRKDKIAIISDVEAMFYQVRVAPCNRDALRFFWWPEGDLDTSPDIYRMKVHPFGARSSPSCASYCLRQTAKEFGKYFDPEIREIVRRNFYVDDCLVSVEDETHAAKEVKDFRSLLAYGGFKLTKWLSNSEEVMKTIPEDHLKVTRNSAISPVTTKERVLGVSWCVIKDEFFFEIDLPKVPTTKRGILSVTNSLYDPLGFVLPVVLRARLLYSEVCQARLGWDQILDEAYRKRWVTW